MVRKFAMPRLPHADGDPHAGLDALRGLGGEPLPADLAGDVGDRRLRGGLADELNERKVHGKPREKRSRR